MKLNICLLVLSLLCFSGCCTLKKTRTITTTVIQVDTIIRVVRDTVTLTKTVSVTDTAYIENSTARAISYIEPATGRLRLELTGKPFDVPLTIYKKEITDSRVRERGKSYFNVWLTVWLVLVALILFLITYLKKKL